MANVAAPAGRTEELSETGAMGDILVWYLLKGKPQAYRVRLGPTSTIVDLKEAVHQQCGTTLTNVDAVDLLVYESKAAFDSQEEALDPMDTVPEQGCNEQDGKPIPFYVHYPDPDDEPKALDTLDELRKGGTGRGSFLWVQVKGGRPIKYPTGGVEDVGDLLKAVYVEVERRLPAGVGVDQLKLYASEEAYKNKTAFEVDDEVSVIVEAGSGKTAQKPLYVDYPEPGGSAISKVYRSGERRRTTAGKAPTYYGKVFADGELPQFKNEQLLSVSETWNELFKFILDDANRIALVRAPPRSGKSFLGELAERNGTGWADPVEVRYCPDTKYTAGLLRRGRDGTQAYADVEAMARDSGESGEDPTRPTIVYFFDEAAEIPEEIYAFFIKKPLGYAVFAASSLPVTKKRVTPTELNDKTFFYRSPARQGKLTEWLQDRFSLLFGAEGRDGAEREEASAAARMLLNIANCHIGIIQYLGFMLESGGARSLRDTQEELRGYLTTSMSKLLGARCFGATQENGVPDHEQSLLVSMLRCCGSLHCRDAVEEDCLALRQDIQSHRRGFSAARYAAVVDADVTLAKLSAETPVTFTHTLQAEIYHLLFEVRADWTELSHKDRWLTDFGDGAKRPTTVLDLVVSWLSHVKTESLLRALDKVDAEEKVFQNSFHEFHLDAVRMKGERDKHVKDDSSGLTGYLDHFVDQKMGVEFLIRDSSDNRHCASRLLASKATRKYMKDHVNRTQSKYGGLAKKLGPKMYVTVLVATLTRSLEEEWTHFKSLIDELKTEGNGTDYPIMVAVAPFGWAKWNVFLWDPELGECVQFEIQRQRLMYKIVNGTAVSARHFYPRPTQVWARELVVESGSLKLTGRAFEVEPKKDNVASLADAIAAKVKSLTCDAHELTIYSQNRADEWQELEEDQVLYENLKERPYGFVVPESAA